MKNDKAERKKLLNRILKILTWKAAAPVEQVQTHVLCSTIEVAPTDIGHRQIILRKFT